MCFHLPKFFFALLLLCFVLPPVFSQGVYLTESEFQELLNIIRKSRANSEEQTRLIAELRETLTMQEAELRQALNSLDQSEPELTELKASLSRIRSYSDGLNAYCLTLEQENAALKSKNKGLKIGIGVSGGSAAVLLIVLLILLL
jgi:septal ring factor EnvC (AmiA/AmiB activator)